ncbi:MAG: SAM-dependent methyltransferase [Bacteroidales bacterium]|nr:SAM-dependent methyltransferase [Bacteroidales bacterium]
MNFDGIDIGFETISFFEKEKFTSLEMANAILNDKTGIVDFFERENDFIQLQQILKINQNIVSENRIEYGDFQTNKQLSESICNYLYSKNINPKILLEPTCGKGSFILSAIKTFDSLQQVFGVEIQEKYLWHLKFELLEYFLNNPTVKKPQINLYHCSVFDFDFKQVKNQINNQELLVIGNPPWVTNSTLSTLNSKNLPKKSNFKNTKGIDAITGKGNFDIGEFISLKMLELFSKENGYFAFLIKNSVLKNIVFEQKKNKYPIANIEKYTISAKKEFDAAVDASLFVCKFNSVPELTAKEFDFYTLKPRVTLGWVNNKFASDTEKYKKYQHLDGICPFEWRQGIKHDCAKIMELERINGGFRNALGEEFELEEDLIYGILKSSDLKQDVIDISRKFTIVTQKRIGQETSQILEKLPKTKAYLERHKNYFLQRKSSIYNGKPMYSIFGVGDYSFKPYKVAISGLYKQTKFTLIKPNGTVLLLDDTCYFIGFNTFEEAQEIQNLLNQLETQEFIESFMFTDAKRAITKDLLMRIGLVNHSVGRKTKQLSIF